MDKAEYANDFLNIIRSLIKEEQQKQDRTEICQIDSINEDGSLNIKMLQKKYSKKILKKYTILMKLVKQTTKMKKIIILREYF